MKTVYQNSLYSFIFDSENHVLIFEWTEKTAAMTDENFIDALSNYAGFAFELKGPGLLVDVRKFVHKMGEEAMKWRNDVALSRYMLAGSMKMAYVMPAQAIDSLPKGNVQVGEFTDHYFGSMVEATGWLKK